MEFEGRAEFVCLRIGSGGRLLWTWYWTFWFYKMRRIPWVDGEYLASEKGLSTTQWVSLRRNKATYRKWNEAFCCDFNREAHHTAVTFIQGSLLHACLHTCIHTHIYIYTGAHAHTHTHTHTHMNSFHGSVSVSHRQTDVAQVINT